jgi:hypothetical protein
LNSEATVVLTPPVAAEPELFCQPIEDKTLDSQKVRVSKKITAVLAAAVAVITTWAVVFTVLFLRGRSTGESDSDTAALMNGITSQQSKTEAVHSAVGTFMTFGGYQWKILDVQDDRMLIITDEIIEQRPYHHECADISWETSDMRAYLNGEFYDRFSESDKARILQVTNSNQLDLASIAAMPGINVNAMTEAQEKSYMESMRLQYANALQANDTQDKIFLLSMAEVGKYFPNESQRRALTKKRNYALWWLRSPLLEADKAPGVNSGGGIQIDFVDEGVLDGSGYGVRPAMWIAFDGTSEMLTSKPVKEVKIGERLEFGGIQWIVLDIRGNEVLALSEEIIEIRPYHQEYLAVSWEDCDLREYLNGTFYNSFDMQDKARIIQTTVKNTQTFNDRTDVENDTLDYFFLLSSEEVKKYLDDAQRKVFDMGSTTHYGYWWLRKPGVDDDADVIRPSGSQSYERVNTTSQDEGGMGVRPALWLRID